MNDVEIKSRANSIVWVQRMRKVDPDHARLYCDHGVYVGSNRLFIDKCEACSR